MTQPLALVTGASSGIGLEIARELARRGHPLALVARRRARLEDLAAELSSAHGVEARVLTQDLAQPGAAEALRAQLQGSPVGILVNNAGFGLQGQFLEMSPERVAAMLQLNVVTLTELTWTFARDMRAAGGGRVLQVASAAAFLPSPYVSAYSATKHYVKAFSEALRFELRGSGVTVTTLYPGITRTEFNAVAGAETPALMRLSILDADVVARRGVEGMMRGRRAVVPGLINKVNAVLSEALHRGLITWTAGALLEDANGHR